MQVSNTRCKHLYIETAWASTYRCLDSQLWYLLLDAFSSIIRASSMSATTWSYRNSHNSRPWFHFPPAYFTWSCSSTSAKPTRSSAIGEHTVILTSHWNRWFILYPTMKIKQYFEIFINIIGHNIKARWSLVGMLDARFGSIRRACNCWFSEMLSSLWS